jgi:drug/metabolite transporter (DMT)-like permease
MNQPPGASAPGHARSSARPGASTTDLMLLGMSMIWAVNFSVIKFGTRQIPPLAFNATRMTLAVAVLGAVLVIRGGSRMTRRDLIALLGLGVIGMGVYQVLFIEGLARTRAGSVALVLAAVPAFVALIGRLLGIEKISARGWMGIALSLGGIAAVSFGTPSSESNPASTMGNLMVFSGALCWAAFTVMVKPYANRVGAMQVSAVTMAGGVVPLIVLASPAMLALHWASLGAGTWAAVSYSGIGALVIASTFWVRGVRVLGPTRTAMYSNLQPVMAIAVAWLALGEIPVGAQWIGAAAIVGGVLLTRS